MERPYIICHMLSALDGRITGKFMRNEKDSQAAGACSGNFQLEEYRKAEE